MLGIKLVKSYSIVMNNFYDNLASVRLPILKIVA